MAMPKKTRSEAFMLSMCDDIGIYIPMMPKTGHLSTPVSLVKCVSRNIQDNYKEEHQV